MKTFEIWHRKIQDGRAPEFIFLDEEYSWVGEISANNLSDVVIKMHTTPPEELELLDNRKLTVGDVLKDPLGTYFIRTPSGVWATVQVLENT